MNEHLAAFVGYLTDKEKSKSTIESYTRSTINLILISINCYFLILEFDLKTTD